MNDLSKIFREGSKVVISPDKMRAWVRLPKPAPGVRYTPEAITQWLPQNGVVYGADPELIRKAAASGEYDELLEVARGKAPVAASGGDYTLKIEKKPFTGLNSSSDGSLVYDDFSFLQEVPAGQVLAEITPPAPAEDGMTVTGEAVPPREGATGRMLEGSGFQVTDNGRCYRAPTLSHVSIVADKLVVTPLSKVDTIPVDDGMEYEFEGNVVVEGDVPAGARFSASGSVFVKGRCVACSIKAGNNVLLSGGMFSGGEYGRVEAGGNVWGLFFESCTILAGGDICSNYLNGCEAEAGGRANILGGRAAIESSTLTATNGVVTGTIGSPNGSEAMVRCGADQELLDRYNSMGAKIDRLNTDIQALQQNITAHERVNRMKPDKGKGDAAYKEMVARRDQSLSVQGILTAERTRTKRAIDQFSTVSIIARRAVLPGAVIYIDTRRYNVDMNLSGTKFRRNGEVIELLEIGASGR